MIGIKFYSLTAEWSLIMKMRSFEHNTVKSIVERIAETKVNNRPFDLIRFRTALRMIQNECWDEGVPIKYGKMEIGTVYNSPCGLLVEGFYSEGEREKRFVILYEQISGTIHFYKDLYH